MVVIGSFVWENKEWKPPPRWKRGNSLKPDVEVSIFF
jgi:hypothetical protein